MDAIDISDNSEKKPKIKRRLGFLVIIVPLLVALGYFVVRLVESRKPEGKQGATESIQEKEIEFAVNITRTVMGPIADYYETNGEIVSASSVDVFADTRGILARLHVELGERVREGQILAEVDPSRPGMQYSLNPVKARISGTITRLPLNRGDIVATSTPVATIGDLDNLQVIAAIPERFISRLHTGMSAQVRLEAWPGNILDMTVDKINPVVDPETRTLTIKMDIPRGKTRAKPGMYAEIRLTTENKENAIIIPADAILRRMGEEFVYGVEDGRVRKRIVTTGIAFEDVIEIVDGLKQGYPIVVQGQNLLEDGVKVRVVREVRREEQ